MQNQQSKAQGFQKDGSWYTHNLTEEDISFTILIKTQRSNKHPFSPSLAGFYGALQFLS